MAVVLVSAQSPLFYNVLAVQLLKKLISSVPDWLPLPICKVNIKLWHLQLFISVRAWYWSIIINAIILSVSISSNYAFYGTILRVKQRSNT